MSSLSELKIRARAVNHDISDPASTDTPVAPLASNTLTGPDVAERLVGWDDRSFTVAADSATGTTVAEITVMAASADRFPNGCRVRGIYLRAGAAITADVTNYATDTFVAYDSTGANNTTVATLTTSTTAGGGVGNVAKFAKCAATLSTTLANTYIKPDGVLTFQRAKAVSGIQVGQCHYTIVAEKL